MAPRSFRSFFFFNAVSLPPHDCRLLAKSLAASRGSRRGRSVSRPRVGLWSAACSWGGGRSRAPLPAGDGPSRGQRRRASGSAQHFTLAVLSSFTCECSVLWTARVLDWQNPFPHSWHLKGFSLEWMYLKARKTQLVLATRASVPQSCRSQEERGVGGHTAELVLVPGRS